MVSGQLPLQVDLKAEQFPVVFVEHPGFINVGGLFIVDPVCIVKRIITVESIEIVGLVGEVAHVDRSLQPFDQPVGIVVESVDATSLGEPGYFKIEGVVVGGKPAAVTVIVKVDQCPVLESQVSVEGDGGKGSEIPACFGYHLFFLGSCQQDCEDHYRKNDCFFHNFYDLVT